MATGSGRSRDLLGVTRTKIEEPVFHRLFLFGPQFRASLLPVQSTSTPKWSASWAPVNPPGEAVRAERQHRRVPFVPLRDEPFTDAPVALFQVFSLHRIPSDIEQKGVVQDLEVLPVAVAPRLLVVSCASSPLFFLRKVGSSRPKI